MGEQKISTLVGLGDYVLVGEKMLHLMSGMSMRLSPITKIMRLEVLVGGSIVFSSLSEALS